LERADKVIADLSLNGEIKRFPKELEELTMFLADVNFEWNPEMDAFVSVGKIGIGNMGKEQVFKYVKGKIMVKKERESKLSDEITMYLELDANNWYYFTYKRGMMQTYSTDKEYNTIVKETKDDKRKAKEGKVSYQFMLGTESSKVKFLKKFDSL